MKLSVVLSLFFFCLKEVLGFSILQCFSHQPYFLGCKTPSRKLTANDLATKASVLEIMRARSSKFISFAHPTSYRYLGSGCKFQQRYRSQLMHPNCNFQLPHRLEGRCHQWQMKMPQPVSRQSQALHTPEGGQQPFLQQIVRRSKTPEPVFYVCFLTTLDRLKTPPLRVFQ